jgi:transglutaminase-like putative cysteine protease
MSISTSRAQKRPWTDAPAQEDEHELPLAPREGWLTLIALVVMIGAIAVAIDDAVWAGVGPGTQESQTKFLPVAALLSVLLGAWLSKRDIKPMAAHTMSALVGGGFLMYAIAGSISSDPSLIGRLQHLNLSVSTFVRQVFVQDIRSSETSVFLLIMGAIVWGAGHFAAFNVFRRHQAAPAIVLAGLIMLINVSLTIREEYVHLVVFVLAALLLIMRLNLYEQMGEWRSRGMRDLGGISGSFVRNGAVMVVVTIVASIVLAANASSAPLSRAWNSFDDQLLDLGNGVNHWLGGVTGAARGPNALFTPAQTIRDFWEASSDQVFTAQLSDGVARRWRGATYDSFDGTQWQQLDRQSAVVDPGANLLEGSSDDQDYSQGYEQVSAIVTPDNFGGDVFVAPADAIKVDQPSELVTNGAGGPFAAGRLSYGVETGVPYTVTSQIHKTSGAGALTASTLAAAGTDYPSWISRYLDIRPGSVGDIARTTALEIYRGLPQNKRDPYHVAEAVQDWLYSKGGFTYTTDVRGLCDTTSKVDCFLMIKKGYCEYFASAMVMLLRELQVPARYVVGYLPGQKQADGSWLVERGAAHAWVEVYFPGNGWLEFDPTPGNSDNGQAPTHLAEGSQVIVGGSPVPATPAPPRNDDNCVDRGGPRGCEDLPAPGTNITPPPASGPPILLLAMAGFVALLALALLLGAFWLRRTPSSQPEIAFSGLTKLAARMGYGPRPSQTPYEYADRLGELVPVAASDVRLIATAKVEATYGRRQPGEGVLASIGVAYRRARLGLLRLLVRKPHVPRHDRRR